MDARLETRCVTARPELRADGDQRRIVGYGAIFNVETVIADLWREVIAPGAFATAIGPTADVRSLFNHNPDIVLGRTAAQTLTLREDERGLWYETLINSADTEALSVAAKTARGDVTGSSIGFRVKREEWTNPAAPGDLPLRRVLEYDELRDVGPVTFPAFEQTTAEARSAAAAAGGPLASPDPDPLWDVYEQSLALDDLEV